MDKWYLLAGTDPEKLKKTFENFFYSKINPSCIALWQWKRTYWICADEKYHSELMIEFSHFNIIEFSSAPSRSDLEFLCGDAVMRDNEVI